MSEGSFFAKIFGWEVTQAPPPITGTDQFGQTPGPSFPLEQSSFTAIPQQSITPQAPTSDNLALASQPSVLGGQFWSFLDAQPLVFDLSTPYNCAVTLSVNIGGSAPGGGAQCQVFVNGKSAGSLPCGNTPGSQALTIPYGLLAPINLANGNNVNTIQLGGGGTQANFMVGSISVQSTNVPIFARARWRQVAAGDLPPTGTGTPASVTYTVDVTSGTTSSKSETDEFATDLTITGSAVGEGALEGLLHMISLSLSAGYTEHRSHSEEHSITIEKSTTKSWSYTLYSHANHKMTYQLWQLEFMYQAGASGQVLTQRLGNSLSPIIINTYTPTAMNVSRPLELTPA